MRSSNRTSLETLVSIFTLHMVFASDAHRGSVWIHDYHLLLVPSLVRQAIPDATIGFFLHTPFPSSELFRCLPRMYFPLISASLCAIPLCRAPRTKGNSSRRAGLQYDWVSNLLLCKTFSQQLHQSFGTRVIPEGR